MGEKNPWAALPKIAPYELADDRLAIERFNARPTRQEEHRVRTHLPPLPFQGNPEAPVVLLGLNLGYEASDEDYHQRPEYLADTWRAMVHEKMAYPFFWLDPAYAGDSGQRWWHRRLSHLRRDSKYHGEFSDQQLANSLLAVQYFPYRSARFRPVAVPSQQYSFELVRAAMRRGALVVLLRSRTLWMKAIPELAAYPNLLEVSAPLYPVLNRQQLGDAGWETLLRALRSASGR